MPHLYIAYQPLGLNLAYQKVESLIHLCNVYISWEKVNKQKSVYLNNPEKLETVLPPIFGQNFIPVKGIFHEFLW